eukprot:TRINITY_DN79565_c0_g1_i1.p1 TRINITY_DN79565_c0_g1~~TRINITY_DN79565_c0_g1_i1.p1  ORF type:complete len:168 (+),score=11.34 TRINITY_DN79565_c0_g1_i1:59-505(+)
MDEIDDPHHNWTMVRANPKSGILNWRLDVVQCLDVANAPRAFHRMHMFSPPLEATDGFRLDGVGACDSWFEIHIDVSTALAAQGIGPGHEDHCQKHECKSASVEMIYQMPKTKIKRRFNKKAPSWALCSRLFLNRLQWDGPCGQQTDR